MTISRSALARACEAYNYEHLHSTLGNTVTVSAERRRGSKEISWGAIYLRRVIITQPEHVPSFLPIRLLRTIETTRLLTHKHERPLE